MKLLIKFWRLSNWGTAEDRVGWKDEEDGKRTASS